MHEVLEKVKKIKRKYEDEWMSYPGVTSVGIGYVQQNTLGIIIGVKGKIDTIRNEIPEQIDNIPITVKTIPEIRAL